MRAAGASRATRRRSGLVRLGRDAAALIATMTRFWVAVFPVVRRELRAWERRATQIPDAQLREHALDTLRSEWLSAAGAAMFAATAQRSEATLVQALVTFQVIWDYLDTLSEQPVDDPVRNGAHLHRALVDALDGGRPALDYYRHHSTADDGGYLDALVQRCRERCLRLPAYARVRPAAVREASSATVQGCNHAPPDQREQLLRRWAAQQDDVDGELTWFELAAAASSSMAIVALLAAAADPSTTDIVVERTRRAYSPWVDALTTLLDSVVDADDDARSGQLSFVGQYPSPAVATQRLVSICRRAVADVRTLPRPERHVVLIAGMMALHFSHASAWAPRTAATTRAVIEASDTVVVTLLLPLLRAWRVVHACRRPTTAARCRWQRRKPRPSPATSPCSSSPAR